MSPYTDEKRNNHIINCNDDKCKRCQRYLYRYFYSPEYKTPKHSEIIKCKYCGKNIYYLHRRRHRKSKLCKAFQRGYKLRALK